MNPKEDKSKDINKSSERKIPYQYLDIEAIFDKVYPKVKPAKKKKDKLETKKIKKERVTYSQDWSAYNQAQSKEKLYLMKFLDELLDYIPFPEHKGVGRKPVKLRDKIFYLTLQAYNIKSSRRCISDLEIAKRLEYIDNSPHFNTILKCLNDPSLIPYFKHLINVSGLPLQQIEKDFAIDSSGFSTSQFDRWFEARNQKKNTVRRFRKCHLTCGVKTNIITAVNITRGYAADSPQFRDLVLETNKIYNVREVSADKAYSSRDNLNTVSQIGGIAYIPFKKNTTGKHRKGALLWGRMYRYYINHQEEFMEHYHKRSNSETVFHMLKMKFGKHIRSKNEIGQSNEILAKCLAHNICVLIQEMFELGIDVDFNKCAEIELAHN